MEALGRGKCPRITVSRKTNLENEATRSIPLHRQLLPQPFRRDLFQLARRPERCRLGLPSPAAWRSTAATYGPISRHTVAYFAKRGIESRNLRSLSRSQSPKPISLLPIISSRLKKPNTDTALKPSSPPGEIESNTGKSTISIVRTGRCPAAPRTRSPATLRSPGGTPQRLSALVTCPSKVPAY